MAGDVKTIRADDLYQINGRGRVFTSSPSGVPGAVSVGDTVRFTTTNPQVDGDEFFDTERSYRVVGIEIVRTLMYPPQVKGYGFVVSPVKEDAQ